MASEYKNYLAASILNEDRVITYRLLSKALKVHVNTAKEMLFEFHRLQNGKKPGSINATYLVAGRMHSQEVGIAAVGATKDGEDEHMQSSPSKSSPMPHTDEYVEDSPALSITLIREEDLSDLRSQYAIITSIHVYSIGPCRLKDPQILSDATREMLEIYSSQDSLQEAIAYGTIANKDVRRRTGQKPSIPATVNTMPVKSSSSTPITFHAKGEGDQNSPSSSNKSSNIRSASSSFQSTREQVARGDSDKKVIDSNNPSQLKRDLPNIFKSFAKPSPKLKPEGTESSAARSDMDSATPSGQEDGPVKSVFEDEEDDYIAPSLPLGGLADTNRKSRQEREAARKMTEVDDFEEEVEDVLEMADQAPSILGNGLDRPTEEVVQVTGDRRRGRRKVVRKKKIKDEEGYLVTIEEQVWESFSEDELVVPKPKVLSSFSSSGIKAKKGPGKPGQGSIMSFFGKK